MLVSWGNADASFWMTLFGRILATVRRYVRVQAIAFG